MFPCQQTPRDRQYFLPPFLPPFLPSFLPLLSFQVFNTTLHSTHSCKVQLPEGQKEWRRGHRKMEGYGKVLILHYSICMLTLLVWFLFFIYIDKNNFLRADSTQMLSLQYQQL
jgi:hypothetical protein